MPKETVTIIHDLEYIMPLEITEKMHLELLESEDYGVDILGADYYEVLQTGDMELFTDWYGQNSWIPECNFKKRNTEYYPELPIAVWQNESLRSFFTELPVENRVDLVGILRQKQISVHLRRLWSSANGEKLTNFAISFLEFLLLLDEKGRKENIERIPDSVDGNSAAQFWTVGPYIYIALTELGVQTHSAMRMLFQWASARTNDVGQESDAQYPGVPTNYLDMGVSFYLTRNTRSVSHTLARAIAMNTAQLMVTHET